MDRFRYDFRAQPLSVYDLQAFLDDGRDIYRRVCDKILFLTPAQIQRTEDFLNTLLGENKIAELQEKIERWERREQDSRSSED